MRELVDVAMDHIINQVITHRVVPGNTLYETIIAEELSMSRTPVRQALNTAVSMGILEHAQGRRGYHVPPLSSVDMEQVFHTRKAIETQAVTEAARKINTPASQMLNDLIIEEFEYLKGKDRIKYASINRKIHFLFVQLSENIYLQRIFDPIFWRTSMYDFHFSDFYSDTQAVSQEQFLRSHAEHKKIAEAVLDGDSEYARLSMEMHLTTTINIYKHRYKDIESQQREEASPRSKPK